MLSGLAACTAITLRMYAERKGWDLRAARVELRLVKDEQQERIERTLVLEGHLAPSHQARLLEIAEKTPVGGAAQICRFKGGLNASRRRHRQQVRVHWMEIDRRRQRSGAPDLEESVLRARQGS